MMVSSDRNTNLSWPARRTRGCSDSAASNAERLNSPFSLQTTTTPTTRRLCFCWAKVLIATKKRTIYLHHVVPRTPPVAAPEGAAVATDRGGPRARAVLRARVAGQHQDEEEEDEEEGAPAARVHPGWIWGRRVRPAPPERSPGAPARLGRDPFLRGVGPPPDPPTCAGELPRLPCRIA